MLRILSVSILTAARRGATHVSMRIPVKMCCIADAAEAALAVSLGADAAKLGGFMQTVAAAGLGADR